VIVRSSLGKINIQTGIPAGSTGPVAGTNANSAHVSERSQRQVLARRQPLITTNLAVKTSFSRVALDGEKLADRKTDVQIQNIK